MKRVGFLGAGNMAEAILQGIISASLYAPDQILVSDIRSERLTELQTKYGVMPAADNRELVRKADIVVLAVKPFHLVEVLAEVQGHLDPQAVVVSIIAGQRIANITGVLGDIPVVRVMPNTPALLKQGASAFYGNNKAKEILPQIKAIFACVGEALEVDSEDLIDAVTAVSGSGPAYYYLLMKAMIDAGVKLGLSPETAKLLVLQTAKGAALLALEADRSQETPADLTRKVATPGGTTEAALNTFEKGAFRDLVEQALSSAHRRSQELSAG